MANPSFEGQVRWIRRDDTEGPILQQAIRCVWGLDWQDVLEQDEYEPASASVYSHGTSFHRDNDI